MKLWEVLNQVKAHKEGISFQASWDQLEPQMAAFPEQMKRFLRTEYRSDEAMEIHKHTFTNIKKPSRC